MPFMPRKKRAPRKKAPARARITAPSKRRGGAPRSKRVRRPRVAGGSMIQNATGMMTLSLYTKPRAEYRPDKLSIMGPKNFYVLTKPYVLSAPDGVQAVQVVGQWNSLADIQGLAAQAQVVSYPPSLAVVGDPMRFLARKINCEVDITNSSSWGCIVDIYDIVARRDVPSSAVAPAGYNVGTPFGAWVSGGQLQLSGSVPSGYTDYTQVPGTQPNDSQLFKDYYRIVSKKTVLLPQVGQHKHRVVIDVQKAFDLNQVKTDSSWCVGYKDFTHFTMLVARGQPLATTDSPVSATTYGPVILRTITTERYEYSWVATSGMGTKTFAGITPNVGNRCVQVNNPTVGIVANV